jgi:hypothetical protein
MRGPDRNLKGLNPGAGVLVAAGCAAAAALPAAALGFDMPVLLALLFAVAVFVTVAAIGVALRYPIGQRIEAPARASPADIAVTREAQSALERLAAAVPDVDEPSLRAQFARIATEASILMEETADAAPTPLETQRLLTYYLPRAAELAETVAALNLTAARDPDRIASLTALADQIGKAFETWREARTGEDLRALDREIRLVRDALAEDDPAKS